MPCKCEDQQYSRFIAGLFGQCMSSPQQIVSFIFGWFSIASWLVALYPQIRINFLVRKAEALSPYFLLCWIIGDVCNVTSCFALNQLFVQKFLSIFWFSTDLILNVSHYFFLLTKRHFKSHKTYFSVFEISIYIVIAGLVINNMIWAGFYYQSELNFNEQAYNFCKEQQQVKKYSTVYWIGTICAYTTVPMCCISRPTQIYKNWKRKSTDGLSTGLFIATSSGNINQLVSMLVYSQEQKYLIEKIPYIFEAAVPAILDIVILIQIRYYKKIQKSDLQIYESNSLYQNS
ncbi:Seven_transmembrane protein 1 [Hexamita inflata]|uniref:Seven transmembrane protein 1 n=1 Tax=Hexamita inflata TaxID=28002 RepID=A0AA86QY48_9EUKA|nr:Seven transmembrane protein 1 [Hexamita inflata]